MAFAAVRSTISWKLRGARDRGGGERGCSWSAAERPHPKMKMSGTSEPRRRSQVDGCSLGFLPFTLYVPANTVRSHLEVYSCSLLAGVRIPAAARARSPPTAASASPAASTCAGPQPTPRHRPPNPSAGRAARRQQRLRTKTARCCGVASAAPRAPRTQLRASPHSSSAFESSIVPPVLPPPAWLAWLRCAVVEYAQSVSCFHIARPASARTAASASVRFGVLGGAPTPAARVDGAVHGRGGLLDGHPAAVAQCARAVHGGGGGGHDDRSSGPGGI